MEHVRLGGSTTASGVLVLALMLISLVGPASASALAAEAPCATGVRACVKLSSSQAWLLDSTGAVVRGPVPITAGAAGMATPTGLYTVQWKDADHVSPFGRAPMPWSVFFDKRGRALHAGSLQLLSRGCVHLGEDDAREFFLALTPGQRIEILP